MIRHVEVVIPLFNSERFIGDTLTSIKKAKLKANIEVSILVVDDGSSDLSVPSVRDWANQENFAVEIVNQPNKGRFEARLTGAKHSKSTWLLFLDSRVRLAEDSLANLANFEISNWLAINGLTLTVEAGGLEASFWEVPTKFFWGESVSDPSPQPYSSGRFDKMPKGTTLLLIRRDTFLELCASVDPLEKTRLISDDTRLLRGLAESGHFIFLPSFQASYVPHLGLGKFFAHLHNRGIVFWDSFRESKGKMKAVSILALVFPCLALAALMAFLFVFDGVWHFFATGVFILLFAWFLAVAAKRGASSRAILSFAVLVFPAIPVYWLGILRGILLRGDFNFRRNPRND